MAYGNDIKRDNDSKKILTMIIMIATLMICTTSATYAYFALTPVTNNAITGTAATASLTLTVTKNYPETNTGPLVPQLETALGSAMNSTNKCVDGNGNVICQVYTVTITNSSTAGVVVNGTITFSHDQDVITSGTLTTSAMPNLKWRKTTSTTVLGTDTTNDASIITAQSLASNVSLAASASATYYMVIWISETGSEQNDTGNYSAVIEFTSSNGTGITSTITS